MLFESKGFKQLQTLLESNEFWLGCCLLFIIGTLWNIRFAWHFETKYLETDTHAPPAFISTKRNALAAPFFGTYIPNVSDTAMAIAHLNQVIVGILFSDVPALSQVILRSSEGGDHIYQVGDTIMPGIEIKAIQSTGIVLSNHGKLEKLNMPVQTLHFSPPPPPLNLKDVSK